MDTSLAHENARLRALLQTQQDTIRQMAKYNRLLSQRVAAYASEINRLKALVAKLQRMQFGKSSEKLRAKTELLFLARILQMLKVGGRSATIVPQGVLFGSSKAHQSLRKTLVEDNQLEAVINLPSGVFKPYAGVATAILIFTKGGQTDEVWFYDLQNDGYSLDDKRNPIKDNDLPHLLASWKHYRTLRGLPVDNFMGEKLASLLKQQYPEGIDAGVDFKDRTQAAFIVPKEDIAAQKYDLSINRYKEVVYQAEEYEDPKVILKRLKDLEKEILADLDELEGML
ncbi:N-6 DNA methylase [Escherichia coli]|nr:N-6 DNA methylase [Escherichia coli]